MLALERPIGFATDHAAQFEVRRLDGIRLAEQFKNRAHGLGGRSVRTENLTSGRLLCAIDAEEGGTPEFIDSHGHKEISAMPPCSGRPWGEIERGDLLQITSRYELKGHTHDKVMGIMVGWVAERKGS
ncbi:hypothetical protein [Actinomadura sp. 6N118]|uniref:hypothetical protein n=1 Tax=Actinomadura sp. 6N118 TaxID=3375151 RepID=UPI00378A2AFB